MSLNGLDSDVIVQAHHDALAEAGGWFLLKYVTRDTVELLGKGTGGIPEARNAIQTYEDKSPLYGLVHYRRKKIILKYVPDGTSRLLQVRLAVHFQSVLDAFTPYDTVFAFVEAAELSESALGLTAMLPASVTETSSISSLRLQRLNEIEEDNEDAVAATPEPTTSTLATPPPPPPPAAAAASDVSTIPAVTATVPTQDPVAVPEPSQSVSSAPVLPKLNTIDLAKKEEIGLDELPASAQRAKAMLSRRRQESGDHMSISHKSVPSLGLSSSKASVDVKSPTTAPTASTALTVEPPAVPQTTPDTTASVPRKGSLAHDKDTLPPLPPQIEYKPLPRPSFDATLFDIESDSDDDLRRPTPKPFHIAPRYSTHLTAAESSSISRWTEDVVASTRSKDRKQSSDSQIRPKTSGTADGLLPMGRKVANMPSTVRAAKRVSTSVYRPGSSQSTRSMPTRWAPSHNLPPPIPSPTIPTFPIADRQVLPSRKGSSQSTSITIEPPSVSPEKLRLMKALQMRKRNQLLAQRSTSDSPTPTDALASLNSFSSGGSQTSTQPTDVSPAIKDVASFAASDATSPFTHLAASDTHSTKPSSISEGSQVHDSATSISSDTNSSTTPRAVEEKEAQNTSVSDLPATSANLATITVAMDVPTAELPEDSREALGIEEPNHARTSDDTKAPSELPSEVLPNSLKRRSRFEGRISIPPQSIELSDMSDDDDSFMDELQHATVEEARPVAVSRNQKPITPVQSRAPLVQHHEPMPSPAVVPKPRAEPYQSPSSPEAQRSASRSGSVRSFSTALPQWPPQITEPLPALPKQKPALGSVISKRIKTFEGLSNRDSIGPITRANTDLGSRTPSSTSIAKRRSFLIQANDERTPEKALSRGPASPMKTEFDLNEEKVTASPWLHRPGTSAETYPPIRKGESVSITAHIVRKETKSSHGTADTTGMFRSPLVVEHGVAAHAHKQSLPVLQPQEVSDSSPNQSPGQDRRRFSFSSFRAPSQLPSPVEVKPHRLSLAMGSRKSAGQSFSETSSVVDDKDKRASRTSRMLKRLSGLGKARARDGNSPVGPISPETPHPDTIQEGYEASDAHMRHVVDIGEVNVQFADSMLWKRRFLRVDDHGFLIFAPPVNEVNTRGKSRKIHLDELQKPSLPDREREEMAWSILLDLRNGGTVQCACESRAAQASVLKMLIDAHGAYHQLYCG